MKYDIIGDIHGYAEQLRELLVDELGYSKKNGHYSHPEPDRKAIFVGDFIDRGPDIKETLEIVKPMVENGAAKAVLGNHEYNALCFHTKTAGRSNSWLRPRNDKNVAQHIETLYQFKKHRDEWKIYLDWFMTLPLFLDLGEIRVVHAAWIPSEINKIKRWTSEGRSLSKSLLQKSAMEGYDEFDAIETVLKGVEIPIPDDADSLPDEDGHQRRHIRIQWWNSAKDYTYEEMLFPKKKTANFGGGSIDTSIVETLPVYEEDVPVFFGHYWLKSPSPEIQATNICCLDYSVAKGGSLVAYKWQAEKTLSNDHFVSVRVKNKDS